jgi:hypothetical protein
VTIAWCLLLAFFAYVFTHRLVNDGEFYPIVFPICGVAASGGGFQLVTGYDHAAITENRISTSARRGLLVVLIAGAISGIGANKLVFGAYL